MMMGSPKLLARGKHSREAVLSFLLSHGYSTGAMLQHVSLLTQSAHWHLLHRLEREGFIIHYDAWIDEGVKIRLYGITILGVHYTTPESRVPNDYRRFEPSKFRLGNLQHHLEIQRFHLWAMKQGLVFHSEKDFYEHHKNEGDKCADGVLEFKGQRIAIEIERNPKSQKRYSEILVNYFREIKNGTFQKVWYVMPNEKLKSSIMRLMTSIQQVRVRGALSTNTIMLKSEHWQYFEFLVHPYYEMDAALKARNQKRKHANQQPQGGSSHDAA